MQNVIFSQKVYDAAQRVVEGCMGHEAPACQSACPMHIDVKQYVKLAGEGKYADSLNVIREKIFLPQTLGRICAHPCEQSCRRNIEFNQPVSVAGIKRFVAEREDDSRHWNVEVAEGSGKKVAIVGVGPAGAQAAIELRRQGHSVTIFEKRHVYGGMLRFGIPEYRLPRDVIDFEYSYIDMLGVETRFGVDVGKDIRFAELRKQYDAVILAHGAHVGSVIPLPGHQCDGVFSAVDYLREISDTRAFPKAGKKIMVIGGGDVAIDCARSSWRIGAEEVYQCSRKPMEALSVSQIEIDKALEEGVKFNTGWNPEAIVSDDNGRVIGIKLRKTIPVYDEEGHFVPTYGEETRTIEVDTVIFATGQVVADITDGELEQGRGGRYLVDQDTLATSIENVFVAGDACGGAIAIEAMALGRKAALSVERLFAGQPLAFERDFEQEYSYESRLNIPLPEGVKNHPRVNARSRDALDRRQDFASVDEGFSEDQVFAEAQRCLQCSCKLCMNECVMMNDFGDCPKSLFGDFVSTKSMDPLLAYSCNACDQCTIVCPKEYPMKDIFLGARADFVKANGGQSPIKGHKAINMHQKLGFSKFFTMAKKAGR